MESTAFEKHPLVSDTFLLTWVLQTKALPTAGKKNVLRHNESSVLKSSGQERDFLLLAPRSTVSAMFVQQKKQFRLRKGAVPSTWAAKESPLLLTWTDSLRLGKRTSILLTRFSLGLALKTPPQKRDFLATLIKTARPRPLSEGLQPPEKNNGPCRVG